jgi:hypothetical protein
LFCTTFPLLLVPSLSVHVRVTLTLAGVAYPKVLDHGAWPLWVRRLLVEVNTLRRGNAWPSRPVIRWGGGQRAALTAARHRCQPPS